MKKNARYLRTKTPTGCSQFQLFIDNKKKN